MTLDDLILSLTKMGYTKADSTPDGDGGHYFIWPKGISSFIAYQNLEGNGKENEWLVDVKPVHVFDYSEEFHKLLIRFYCISGNVGAYLFSDSRNENDFKEATCAASIESIGDLAYLINSKFEVAVHQYVRSFNAKN